MKKYEFNTFVIFLFFNFSLLHSQEINIPADTAKKIFVITSEISDKLGIFKEYENLQEARLFKLNDSIYYLEINYKKEDLLIKNRISFNQWQLDSFRLDFTDKLLKMNLVKDKDQEGRLPLIITSTVIGLGFWGWALPITFEVDNTAVFTGLYLLTAGSSFAIPYFLTANSDIPKAVGTFSSWGAIAGIYHGLFLFDLVNGGITNAPSSSIIGTMLFSSISEMLTTYSISKSQNFTSGKSSTLISTSILGTFLGFALTDFFDFYETPRLWSGVTLGTTGLGYLLGDYLTKKQSYSEGDALVLTASGMLGAALPISIVALAEPSSSKPFSLYGAFGACLGLWLGDFLTSPVDFESSYGDYIMLGTFGGGLIGAGIGLIITSNDESRKSIPLFGTIGGMAGFSALYFSFKGKAAKASMTNINFEINPFVSFLPFISKYNNIIYTPIMNFQWKF